MTSKKPLVIAVIPAFNESRTIKDVVIGVGGKVSHVIVIDDGSLDGTGGLAKKVGASVIVHSKNIGYEASLSDGFRKAVKLNADIILTFDADGESLPSEINKLLNPVVSGKADISVGRRKYKRHFAEKVFSLYTKFFYGIDDPMCGMKAYKRDVYEQVGYFDTLGAGGAQLMLEGADLGFKIKQVSVKTARRMDDSRFYNRRIAANINVLRALVKMIAKKKEKW